MAIDFLIVGQGVAGSLLARSLLARGVTVRITDADRVNSASQVAPGIVNPLAGQRLKPAWCVDDALPHAVATYQAIEAETGNTGRFWHPTPIVRVILDDAQRAIFDKRFHEDSARPYIGEVLAPGALGPDIHDAHGSFVARCSGWLDAAALTRHLRQRFAEAGQFVPSTGHEPHADAVGAPLPIGGEAVGRVIFCDGWRGANGPWFGSLPWRPARGEMLDVTTERPFLPEPYRGCILNRSKWLLPLGDNRYRAGASYAWDDFEGGPTDEKREEILDGLRALVRASFKVSNHRVGVRPVIAGHRPVAGLHPLYPRLGIFNGLGSKGVLHAPWLADRLADHLLNGTDLPSDADVGRRKFSKSPRAGKSATSAPAT